MERVKAWEELPILLNIDDLRRLGLSKQMSYTVMHSVGRQIGKRLVVTKASVQNWLEKEDAALIGRCR